MTTTKTTTKILWGWLSCTLVIACNGDDKETAGMETLSPTTTASTTMMGTTNDSETSTTSAMSGSASETGMATSTGGTTGSTTDTGCSFLDCPCDTDSCGGMGDPQCDVWAQDCPKGEKCMPWANDGGSSWNATKCSPLDPNPGKPGDPCTVEGSGVSGIDSCELGAMCWNVDPETSMGYCIGFCDGSPESYSCAEAGTTCTIVNNGVLILCLPGCDPLLQDCMDGDVCIPTQDGFVCVLDASGMEGQYGDPCEFANVCDPGLLCLAPEAVPGCKAGGCCSPFCELDVEGEIIKAPAPNCPDPLMACVNIYDAGTAPPGLEKVGYCAIPG